MPSPNQIQAINLLRRVRSDPMREEAKKAAQAIVDKVQGVALDLTPQRILQTAIASFPDETISDALARLSAEVDRSRDQDRQLQAFFAAAHQAEEQRLAPIDAACAIRMEQIQVLLEATQKDYRSKIMTQDATECRWRRYVDKGLSREEILKLEIPEPTPGRDFMAERNEWGRELEQTTQALTSERDAIHRFRRTRNENALPQSVLALVEVQA
jgi:hypothetical protein